MIARRGGWDYVKCIEIFEKALYKIEIINLVDYFYYMILRSIVAMIPEKLRLLIYKNNLRK